MKYTVLYRHPAAWFDTDPSKAPGTAKCTLSRSVLQQLHARKRPIKHRFISSQLQLPRVAITRMICVAFPVTLLARYARTVKLCPRRRAVISGSSEYVCIIQGSVYDF